MELDFSDILQTDPLPRLEKKAPPGVKYRMFTELYELTEVAHAVQEIIAEVRQNDEFNRLLIRQNDDGTWPSKQEFSNEQRQQSMQFFSQIMELHRLLDHGATRDVPEVQEGIVALMKMQHPDGKFPLFYQHQGYALWVLMRYGLQGNPFVDRGMRWLLRRQRNDGGWLHLVHVPAGEDKDTYPSCIWTTCHVLWPLVLHNVYYKDDRVRKGLDYLLDNFLQTNHTKFLNAPDAWDYLYVGYDESGCFRGGTLKVLEIVTNAGYDRSNTVVKKASNWLRDQQLDSGLFPAVAGKDTVGDFMVTLRALSVLKKLFSDSVIK